MVEDIVRQSKKRNEINAERVSKLKSLVGSVTQRSASSRDISNNGSLLHEMYELTKQLNMLKNIENSDELTRNSIFITEIALRRVKSSLANLFG